MAAGSLYIDFVVHVGFGVVQFLGKVLPKFLRKFWWNFSKAGPIAGAVLSKGYNQRPEIDYAETFSPVIKSATIQMVLCVALSKK